VFSGAFGSWSYSLNACLNGRCEEVWKISFLDDLIAKLDGLRTLVVYDSPVGIRNLLFFHIVPKFDNKNIYVAVYSESMCRRMKKSVESLIKLHPEIARKLEEVRVIKVGSKKEVPFGKLHQFIELNDKWCDELACVINTLDRDDLLIFHGFSIVQIMYERKWLIDKLNFFEKLPDDVTIVNKISREFYSGWVEGALKKLHDVVIRVEKSERGLIEGEDCYTIAVDQSIVADIAPKIARFRIGDRGFEEY